MSEVKKFNSKLYVLVPPEVAESLMVKEGDELDFSKGEGSSFMVAKRRERDAAGAIELGEKELDVLWKLDAMRYNERTKGKVDLMLNAGEKAVLARLVDRKFVTLYRKDLKEQYKYGISKSIYEKFLFGKRGQRLAGGADARRPEPMAAAPQRPVERKLDRAAVKRWEEKSESGYIVDLEEKGYVVLRNEAEAASASAALEDSIRQGLVVGTRAFDKKFYIGMRGFLNRNGPKVMNVLERGKSVSADEIASELHIDVDAVKTVLYILADKGDVTELRREVFKIA